MFGIGREQKNKKKNIFFRKMRCLGSRGHFSQQIPESPVFQLQNASRTSLHPFIMENIDNNSVLLFYFSSNINLGSVVHLAMFGCKMAKFTF